MKREIKTILDTGFLMLDRIQTRYIYIQYLVSSNQHLIRPRGARFHVEE